MRGTLGQITVAFILQEIQERSGTDISIFGLPSPVLTSSLSPRSFLFPSAAAAHSYRVLSESQHDNAGHAHYQHPQLSSIIDYRETDGKF